jgi:hypothetical protein
MTFPVLGGISGWKSTMLNKEFDSFLLSALESNTDSNQEYTLQAG